MVPDDQSKLYWLEMADYDLETARAMLHAKRFIYVGFMCQQVIEKSLKGLIVSLNPETSAPYIHNLTKLAKLAGIYDEMDSECKDTIDFLEPLNIEARYPSSKDKLLSSLTLYEM
jgi:HEPN domain-containing protein